MSSSRCPEANWQTNKTAAASSSTLAAVEMPGSHQVLLGLSWSEGEPRVRRRTLDQAVSEVVPLIGTALNYSASPSSPRLCLGHHPFRSGIFADCLRAPVPPGRKCASCAASDATFAANLHHAHTRDRSEIDPSIAKHLEQPNVLYLAAFRDGSIKVGTSTEKRAAERLAEQGAWVARIVARTADGYAVRVIEDRVTEQLGLPQAVPVARKLAGMHRPRLDDRLMDEVDHYAKRVGDLLSVLGEVPAEPLDERWRFPRADDEMWQALHPYPLRLDSGQHDIDIVSACGRMVAVKRPGSDDTFLADLQQLYGVAVEIGDFDSDELAVQDSLF